MVWFAISENESRGEKEEFAEITTERYGVRAYNKNRAQVIFHLKKLKQVVIYCIAILKRAKRNGNDQPT